MTNNGHMPAVTDSTLLGAGGVPVLRSSLRVFLFTLPVFFSLCGCAASRLDIIQVGPWSSPRPEREVSVFSSQAETRRPWSAIALIHGPRLPAGSKAINKQKLKARAAAAGMGADGLILTVRLASTDSSSLDIRQDPEIFLSGFAIKYDATISTGSQRQ